MARLAWFSPMPPARTGVATYSRTLIERLAAEHDIDVFVDEPIATFARSSVGDGRIRSAHDFLWRHRLTPYDLTVYQLGNSSAHDFLWPYLFRFPGLSVLHDAQLHHARAAALLRERRIDDYRREFVVTQPGVSPDVAELAIAGFDNYLYYHLPMTRLVVRASKVTAVHAPLAAAALRTESPGASIETIRLGYGAPVDGDRQAAASARVRARFGLSQGAILFGAFGGLTPEKRVPQLLEAFAALLPHVPLAHLVLAGAPASHYDLAADIQRLGLDRHATVTGYVDDEEEFTALVAACDVAITLRWPTAREVSGPWLQALAAGKPTITIDLAHSADVPALDPRSWTVLHASDTLAPPEPVRIAIDILDEAHSLRLAMRRLAGDSDLRARLGRNAFRYWQANHTVEGLLGDYRRVIAQAIATPARAVSLPPHLRADGTERLATLLRPFGIDPNVWGRI